jgi:hypothetical protein
LQLAQIAASFELQLGPKAATPLEQAQLLAWQASPWRVQPALQLTQRAALVVLQSAPVAAIPFEQEQLFALHDAFFESA